MLHSLFYGVCNIFFILNINHFKVEFLQEQLMLTAKPVTVIINMSEKDFIRQNNKWLKPIFAWVNEHSPGISYIKISVPTKI